jgi:two-component system nitrate/nitrite response regulator NarL
MRAAHRAKKKIRVLIADTEGVFRLGLKKLLGVEDDMRVIAEAETATQVLELTKSFKPDIVLAQLEVVEEGNAELLARLRKLAPKVKIVIMASSLKDEDHLRLVKEGTSGILLKTVDPALFVKCVRKVIEGEMWIPKRHVFQMAKLLEKRSDRPLRPADTLTRREKTIISYLMQGWRNREIAQALSITEQTVKNHLRTVYDKVGVSDRLELVLYAIHQHLELPSVQVDATDSQVTN